MDFSRDFIGKFRKDARIHPSSSSPGLPGKILNKNGSKMLLTSNFYDITLSLPSRSGFAETYESCLELIYGVRQKKARKFAQCGINNLRDALKHEDYRVEAKRALELLNMGFGHVRDILKERFSPSHRMFFLLLSFFKKEDLLFVDIETRSLNFETAIIIIGAGYFEENKYRVDQFTALNEAGEYEIIQEFKKLLPGRKAFVTFNGKSFDIPYIDSRLAYYGDTYQSLTEDYHNFDLLHFSRCAFKDMYGSYKLKEMETKLLGKSRKDDIDGSEVDYYYSRYLQTGKADFINPIVYHNNIDIMSLAELTGRINEKWK
ncbi:MAG TPA: ribonuclease H-like domain-containing protein [Candidatus Goldiibacteriota bacterium]|nr:ribonuclease H-like domain-containing protein [Candidatus Goldiibacteriota bacterium]